MSHDVTQLLRTIPPRSIPTYDHLSYSDFLTHHAIPNTPFLLSSSCTTSWPAVASWRLPSSQTDIAGPSRPNLTAMRKYENHIVPVANTHKREFSEFERTERPLGQVLNLWEKGEGEGLYVKDWHLIAQLEYEGGRSEEVYEVPECFRDDWLNPPYHSKPPSSNTITSPVSKQVLLNNHKLNDNHQLQTTPPQDCQGEQCHNKSDRPPSLDAKDFRFVYVGPAGTFTPIHRDVYASYSWSANVVGRKIWWLFPPSSLPFLKGKNGEVPFDIREKDSDLEVEALGTIKILQQEGEILFVPSGWYHQVVNVDSCISINHNFFSSPTLLNVFRALENAQSDVEDSLEDVKQMIISRHSGTETIEDSKSALRRLMFDLNHLAQKSIPNPTIPRPSPNPAALKAASPSTLLEIIDDSDMTIASHAPVTSDPTSSPYVTSLSEPICFLTTSTSYPPELIQSHLCQQPDDLPGNEETRGYVEEWEKEWIQQVQDILRLDAGWNWSDFWDCVLRNISDFMDEVSLRQNPSETSIGDIEQYDEMKKYEPPKEMRDEWVREVIRLYSTKREWKVLEDVREVVRRVGGVVGYE
ncbi:hypothetical protein M231_05766 [Tremella mesenterica]|uniref:JmjC domain-containing protein n=1 Tax=Tremella mesenterica TaxID=5217 RepID=A0A4Q1BH64_TREME|nr:hypothetical protein M231_05766 [Tremella mesenterica]